MRYTFASLPSKTRLMIMVLMLAATFVIVFTDYVPSFFAGFTGGLLIGLLLGELGIYLKRIGRL